MDVNRGQQGPPTCFKCRKRGHIAQNCWARVEQARMMTKEDWRELEEEERQKGEEAEADLNLKD